jgi:ftsJ-like methyltransferase
MKKRLDVLLVEKGIFTSREKAKSNIMAGNVFVDNILVDKVGINVEESAIITTKSDAIPYVGRGGLKLEKALDEFGISVDSKICMDIGASTGGFTDCMLQNGASKVYSIDVGYGQLDYKLRINEKVVCMERTNFRYLEREKILDEIDFAVIDVSFISLKIIFPKLKEFLSKKFEVVSLIKPQFESQRHEVGKNGIVRDISVHKRVIKQVIDYARKSEIYIKNLTFSPIKGQKGNIEYLAYFSNTVYNFEDMKINEIVEISHECLDKNKVSYGGMSC